MSRNGLNVELVTKLTTSGLPGRPNFESWVVWSSVSITQAVMEVDEGEVGIAGGMRIK
jgi:hypothetical protein